MKNFEALDLNSKHIKTYATKEKLLQVVEAKGLLDVRHITVRNDSGKWTMVFLPNPHSGEFNERGLLGCGFPVCM